MFNDQDFARQDSRRTGGLKVILKPSGEEKQVKGKMTVKKLLETLELNPEEYLVTRDGLLLTRDDLLRDDDIIIIIPVISGGAS